MTMNDLIEMIASDIIAKKENAHSYPIAATYSEIIRHPALREAVISTMRALGIKGKFTPTITVNKDPMLCKKTGN